MKTQEGFPFQLLCLIHWLKLVIHPLLFKSEHFQEKCICIHFGWLGYKSSKSYEWLVFTPISTTHNGILQIIAPTSGKRGNASHVSVSTSEQKSFSSVLFRKLQSPQKEGGCMERLSAVLSNVALLWLEIIINTHSGRRRTTLDIFLSIPCWIQVIELLCEGRNRPELRLKYIVCLLCWITLLIAAVTCKHNTLRQNETFWLALLSDITRLG